MPVGWAGLVRELFHQEAHREVDAQGADLIAAEIVDDRVRDPDRPARGLEPGELAGMGA